MKINNYVREKNGLNKNLSSKIKKFVWKKNVEIKIMVVH